MQNENRQHLIKKIHLGEDTYLELKEVVFEGNKIRGPYRNDLSDEIASFANHKGGMIILGVNDESRDITGIPADRLDLVEIFVQEICEQSIKPSVIPIIEKLTLPDLKGEEQPVIKIVIQSSIFVHQSAGGYFHRIGSSKRQIPPDHLARLFQQRSQSRIIRFDETPVSGVDLSILNESLISKFFPANTRESKEIILAKLGMAAKNDSGIWQPTIAGVLMGSDEPDRYIAGAFIQAVAYSGINTLPADNLYQLDAKDIKGTLDHQILEACDFVYKNMQIYAAKGNRGGRQDFPQYDLLSVFEAVTNAVAHRDYSMGGSKIRLRMFSDRLEIYSPGMLPNTMTTDSMPYRQASRNETITSLLARCPVKKEQFQSHRIFMMDKRGEGVPVILERSFKNSGRMPEYRLADESELLLIIYGFTPDL
jgi:ATP-dependent DNA helicase RecG